MNRIRQELTVNLRVCLAALWLASGLIAGCSSSQNEGEVSGAVLVDGKPPAAGSSITFIPTDGASPTAGAVIENGTYRAMVPVGVVKVEIRAPRPARQQGQAVAKQGPGAEGPGGGGIIEESLPAKYNDASELTLEVKPGKNPKDWNLESAP